MKLALLVTAVSAFTQPAFVRHQVCCKCRGVVVDPYSAEGGERERLIQLYTYISFFDTFGIQYYPSIFHSSKHLLQECSLFYSFTPTTPSSTTTDRRRFPHSSPHPPVRRGDVADSQDRRWLCSRRMLDWWCQHARFGAQRHRERVELTSRKSHPDDQRLGTRKPEGWAQDKWSEAICQGDAQCV